MQRAYLSVTEIKRTTDSDVVEIVIFNVYTEISIHTWCIMHGQLGSSFASCGASSRPEEMEQTAAYLLLCALCTNNKYAFYFLQ